MTTGLGLFSEFRGAVIRDFGPLATRYGLSQLTEHGFPPEIHIEFSAAACRLIVSLELGSGPWVEVQVLDRGRETGFGLHTLEEYVEGGSESTNAVSAMPTVEQQVRVLTDLTDRYAGELLRGDPRRLPALKLLRAKAHRERNFAMFGTRSGVTPLDHRPTLQELFASAREAEYPANARMFSVYQAVWDHGYSVEDTAKFLRVAPGDIQQILDAIDDVSDDRPDLEALRKIVASE